MKNLQKITNLQNASQQALTAIANKAVESQQSQRKILTALTYGVLSIRKAAQDLADEFSEEPSSSSPSERKASKETRLKALKRLSMALYAYHLVFGSDSSPTPLQGSIDTIARTEMFKAYNQRILQNSKKVKYSAVLDKRTCPTCESNDGKVFPANSAPSIPAHPSCRCVYYEI